MGSGLTTLTSAEIERFSRDGYVVVRQAFSPADALAMERRWWSELADEHGIRADDRSSWHQIPGDLKAAKRDPIQTRILTDRVRGVFDDLVGEGAWSPPKDWGRAIVTFPGPGAWKLPTHFWHWDNPCEPHLDHPTALFVVSFIGPVAPRSGGTLIISGSPRLLMQQERQLPADERGGPGTKPWNRFHRSHPWLMALTGLVPPGAPGAPGASGAPGVSPVLTALPALPALPADRIAAFMDSETLVDGVPLRVVELTGEPGDMIFCHPLVVHCMAPNAGTRPRFMRIKQQLLTHEGRELYDRWWRPQS